MMTAIKMYYILIKIYCKTINKMLL
jgi:hypothetical protein